MAERKYVTAVINATGGGTVTAPVVSGADITTYDDRKRRTVVGMLATAGTSGIRVKLVDAGGTRSSVDYSMFSAASGYLPLNTVYEVGDYFHVDLENTNAGATNGLLVSIAYEVDT